MHARKRRPVFHLNSKSCKSLIMGLNLGMAWQVTPQRKFSLSPHFFSQRWRPLRGQDLFRRLSTKQQASWSTGWLLSHSLSVSVVFLVHVLIQLYYISRRCHVHFICTQDLLSSRRPTYILDLSPRIRLDAKSITQSLTHSSHWAERHWPYVSTAS
jgi:hypothetical protein